MYTIYIYECIDVCTFIAAFYTLDFYLSLVQLKSYPLLNFWMKRKPNKTITYNRSVSEYSKSSCYEWHPNSSLLHKMQKHKQPKKYVCEFRLFSKLFRIFFLSRAWFYSIFQFDFGNKVAKTRIELTISTNKLQNEIIETKWIEMKSYTLKK